MYQSDFGGPPAPPFRHRRGGNRNKGCLGKFSAIPTDAKIKVGLLVLGMLLSFACGAYWIFKPGQAGALKGEPAVAIPPTPPGPSTPTRAMVQPEPPAPVSPLDTPSVKKTATFQAAISRPAGNPASQPYYVGVITYEDGCLVSNLGFTTSGYNGKPYYLYLGEPLDRDPAMQIVQINGYVQTFDTCQYPVIFVQQLYWIGGQGTPAPLAIGGLLTGTVTATVTTTWGRAGGVVATKTPTYTVWIPPQKDLPAPATYTPYPTYTPQPADVIYKTVVPLIPTYTPYPTWTPDPSTPTPTATATPQPLTLYGPIRAVGGCPQTNFAVEASGTNYFIILAGAALPPGDPTQYWGLITGQADQVCSGQAIRASQITWYQVTPTPTAMPTATLAPTATLTATITP